MKKLALGLIFAIVSSGAFAQGNDPNTTAGGASTGAGGAAGAQLVISTNLALIAAGVLGAVMVAAGGEQWGSNSKSTTFH